MKRVFTVSELLDVLYKNGWQLHSQKGSHRQFTHPLKRGRVTVPGKLSATVHPKTLKSILKQAGLPTEPL
ncbi:MAG: type II toxin-antitoxin system HicA family toxin [Prevotellaceae bacterium]|jgi:predicted RNA binding protein YcfA (HicA-like mRNA interferase family)|nr:type II toxin-antitoxin system HicA family toxin [Prevotellaceae bacterium]